MLEEKLSNELYSKKEAVMRKESGARGGADSAEKIIGSLIGVLLAVVALAMFYYYGTLALVSAL